MNYHCSRREILLLWVKYWLKIQDLQNKVNSLSDARELYDPEAASSSGASHVPSQPSNIPDPRTMPCRDSGLPHAARTFVGTSGNVFERLLAREGLPSALFQNSKNLTSSSQEWRPDTTETARKRDSGMQRESLNTSIPSHHFQSGGGMLNYTGGTYSHNGFMDNPRIPFSELNLGKFPDSLEFQSWKVNFRTEVCLRAADPQITLLWIKEVGKANTTWRTCDIAIDYGANNFPWLRYAWCVNCVCI